MVLAPLLLLSTYALIYLAVFKVRPTEMSPTQYVLYVLSGLLPFLAFSDGIAAGSSSLTTNRAILLSTVFPAELVPIRAVVASQAPSFVGLLLCVSVAILLGFGNPSMLLVPVIWLLLLLFVAGVAQLLALATLVVKDVQQALGFVTMILLIASPIGYTLAMAPPVLRRWLQVNPLAQYIEAMHQAIVYGRVPGAERWAIMSVISVTSFFGAYWLFGRAKRALFDYA